MKTSFKNKHNIFHWSLIVLIKIFLFIIQLPLVFYILAFGFAFSQPTLQVFLPNSLIKQTTSLINTLPYFTFTNKFILKLLGNWYQNTRSWWAMVLGIPLILSGIRYLGILLADIYQAVFNPLYNKANCFWCKKAKNN